MICISVTPESRQLAKVDLLNAARQCDLIELCLDRLLKEPDIKDLVDSSKKPVLISCRRQEDGGQFRGTEDERQMLLRQAVLANPAYIELDLETARRIPRFGKVQRVISFTSLTRPWSSIEDLFDEAVGVKADVIKFTGPTPTLEAAWPLLHAVSQKRSLPIVALGLGNCGLTFSLLGRKYGSPWIYAALEQGMEAFTGQPTVGTLDDIYRWREVGPKTRFFGLAGFGPAEELLAKVFNAGFDSLDLGTRCLPFAFQEAGPVAKMLDVLKLPAVVSIPECGRRLMPLAKGGDPLSEQANFADVFVKQTEGWKAHNLLGRLAIQKLEKLASNTSNPEKPLERRNVLVVGSGGLGQTLAVAALQRGSLLNICGADEEATQKLAAHLDCRFIPVGKLYDTHIDAVILTEPHLDFKARKTPINPALLRPGLLVLDACSLPHGSPLSVEARERGCKLVDPAELFAEYVGVLFKSLTGKELPAQAFAVALGG